MSLENNIENSYIYKGLGWFDLQSKTAHAEPQPLLLFSVNFKSANMKKCNKCKEVKAVSNFYNKSNSKDGYDHECKDCVNIRSMKYSRTINGLVSKMYANQKYRSKTKFNLELKYTKEEFRNWLLSNTYFYKLYNNWIKSNYNKDSTPSVDRDNNYKPYTLNNMSLMTWYDNNKKGHDDIKNGLNNKNTKAVLQYDLDGNFIKEHYSSRQAQRETGALQPNIFRVCNGTLNKTGGYKWRYKS